MSASDVKGTGKTLRFTIRTAESSHVGRTGRRLKAAVGGREAGPTGGRVIRKALRGGCLVGD